MANEKLSLEELLKRQEKGGLLLATIEQAEQPDYVKITPYAQNLGCLCSFTITVQKLHIKSVTPTGETHFCCGKQLLVTTIEFTDVGKPYAEVLGQLQKNALMQARPNDHSRSGGGTSIQPWQTPPVMSTLPVLPPSYVPARGPLAPSIVCPFGWAACIGQCGQRCYDPASGSVCSNGMVCPFGWAVCGCTCYDPSAGATCYQGTVIGPMLRGTPYGIYG